MQEVKLGKFKHTCLVENAAKFREWIACRGGVAVWPTVNMSNPGKSWSTPARTEEGEPTTKPTWEAHNAPCLIVTDEKDIGVITEKEVKRFHVATRHGRSNPLLIKLTDASARRLNKEVEKAGEGAWHTFDYSTQEAIIMVPAEVVCLKDWAPDGTRAE